VVLVKSKLAFGLLSMMLVVTLASTIFQWQEARRWQAEYARSQAAVKEPADPDPTVEVAVAGVAGLSNTIVYHGIIQPRRTVTVTPKISGRVEKVLFEMGDRVKKNDLLVAIEASELDVQVRQAQASVSLARASLDKVRSGARPEERAQVRALVDQARSNLEAARLVYERTKLLYDENVVSKQDLDRAETQYEVARSQVVSAEQQLNTVLQGAREEDVHAAEAQLAQAEAALELAELQREYADLKAPIDGLVAQRMVDVGTMVSTSTPICVIVDTDTIRVTVGVTEDDVVTVSAGQAAFLRVDATPGRSFPAEVRSVAPAADRETRLFSVVVEAPNPDGVLRPGMYASVEIVTQKADDVVVIPRQAVITEEDGTRVFVVTGGVCELRNLKTGVSQEGLVEVVSGVSQGELVVVKGQHRLRPGVSVNTVMWQ